MNKSKVLGPVGLVVALVVAAVGIALDGGPYWIRLATTFAMYGALALSWNIIGGMAGYPSFASAAFFGLGAYTGGILITHGWPLAAAALGAAVLTGAVAALLGLLVLHLRGHYFAIASLMITEAFREIANNAGDLTGGGMGLTLPMPAGDALTQARLFLFAMALCCVGAALACVLISRARLGVALRCIAQNEAAALTIGIDARRAKNLAFAYSSCFAGAAGAVYAAWVGYIDPNDVFDVMLAVKPLVMVLLGGAAVWVGPLVGALVFIAFEELVWRNMLHFHSGLLGLFIALLVIYFPGGLAGVSGWFGARWQRLGLTSSRGVA